MTPGPVPPRQQPGSRLRVTLLLVAVAVVFGGGGALGADVALGSSSTSTPRAPVSKKPAIPKAFQALPSPCALLTADEIAQVIPHAKQPPDQTSTDGPNGDPGGACEWKTSSDFPGKDRTIEIDLDLHPSTAQGAGTDLAKQVFDKKAADYRGKAGTSKKPNAYQTYAYGPFTQLPGVGDEAYSIYYTITDTTGNASSYGYAEVNILRGNAIIQIQSSGFDLPPGLSDTKVPPLADADLRPMAEAMARFAVPHLDSCTACAGR